MRPRVLVIAEAANPEWVSVPLVGWSLASALRAVADVHIVTQIRNRDAFLRAGLVEGEDFTAIDNEAVARPLWRLSSVLRMGQGKGWTLVTATQSLSYLYFERKLWQKFGPDIRAGRYDIVHRVTPLGPTAVSPVAAKCAAAGVAFVLGPLNGGVPWPPGFGSERRREREWLSYVRNVYKLMPGRRRMYRSAAAVIVGSRHTATEVPQAQQDRVFYIPENAIDPDRFNLVSRQSLDGPIRACFIGRLVPYKGPDMALQAAAPLLRDNLLHFDIIGDGPMRDALKALVEREKIAHAVTFHGTLDHKDVQKVAVRSNIFVFPSIREFGGGVVLEAMALGVVPVVVDYAGPGELVDPTFGFKIPIGTRDQIVQRLHDTLAGIVDDPSHLPVMAEAGRARVAEAFTWSAKAAQIRAIYDWVADPAQDKPRAF